MSESYQHFKTVSEPNIVSLRPNCNESPCLQASSPFVQAKPNVFTAFSFHPHISDGDSLAHTKLTQLRTQDSDSLAHTKVSQLYTQGLRGMGWGLLTSLSFLLSSRHRHCSFMIGYRWVGVGWGGVEWGGVITFMFLRTHRHSNLIIFLAVQQIQALLIHDQLPVGWGGAGWGGVIT